MKNDVGKNEETDKKDEEGEMREHEDLRRNKSRRATHGRD